MPHARPRTSASDGDGDERDGGPDERATRHHPVLSRASCQGSGVVPPHWASPAPATSTGHEASAWRTSHGASTATGTSATTRACTPHPAADDGEHEGEHDDQREQHRGERTEHHRRPSAVAKALVAVERRVASSHRPAGDRRQQHEGDDRAEPALGDRRGRDPGRRPREARPGHAPSGWRPRAEGEVGARGRERHPEDDERARRRDRPGTPGSGSSGRWSTSQAGRASSGAQRADRVGSAEAGTGPAVGPRRPEHGGVGAVADELAAGQAGPGAGDDAEARACAPRDGRDDRRHRRWRAPRGGAPP